VNGLFVVHSDIESLRTKGVLKNILERDEGALLHSVITLHPLTRKKHVEDLGPNNAVHELKQPDSSSLRPVSWLKLAWHLVRATWYGKKLVRKNKVDFIRAQDPFLCGFIGYAISRLTRKPFCISIHADYEKMNQMDPGGAAPRFFGSYRLTRRLESYLLRRADLVLAISGYIAEYAKRRGARPHRVRLFRHFVDPRFFGLPNEPMRAIPPIIAVVSRLSRQKYILDLPRIARALLDLGANFRIEVAGDGEARRELEEMIKDLDLSDRIILLGYQDRQGVRTLLGRSSVCLVLCGGASLLEAAAMSKPPVAYDWEWHGEIVETGKTGVLVPEGDTLAAAKALRYLLQNPEMADDQGLQARKRVTEMYRRDGLMEARRSAYAELIGLRSASMKARVCSKSTVYGPRS
jgi:glycosyltransferase involved in cell wall biosynthesis